MLLCLFYHREFSHTYLPLYLFSAEIDPSPFLETKPNSHGVVASFGKVRGMLLGLAMADEGLQAVLDPEREHCAPKWKKPFIHGGFGWKGYPRGYFLQTLWTSRREVLSKKAKKVGFC